MIPTLHIRLDWDGHKRFGPGKARLLALIGEHGSISAAARAMAMSYRRAWLLTEQLNTLGPEPLVTLRTGGAAGGGAALTPAGTALLDAYTQLMRQAEALPSLERVAGLIGLGGPL